MANSVVLSLRTYHGFELFLKINQYKPHLPARHPSQETDTAYSTALEPTRG